MSKTLSPTELTAARARRRQARASLAIEGLVLTPAQEAMFDQFEAERLPHDERLKRILSMAVLTPAE